VAVRADVQRGTQPSDLRREENLPRDAQPRRLRIVTDVGAHKRHRQIQSFRPLRMSRCNLMLVHCGWMSINFLTEYFSPKHRPLFRISQKADAQFDVFVRPERARSFRDTCPLSDGRFWLRCKNPFTDSAPYSLTESKSINPQNYGVSRNGFGMRFLHQLDRWKA
jgi:hypothetical protein